MPTCVTNVGQSGSDHTGTDGLNWFSAIGPDLSGLTVWSKHAEISPPINIIGNLVFLMWFYKPLVLGLIYRALAYYCL